MHVPRKKTSPDYLKEKISEVFCISVKANKIYDENYKEKRVVVCRRDI